MQRRKTPTRQNKNYVEEKSIKQFALQGASRGNFHFDLPYLHPGLYLIYSTTDEESPNSTIFFINACFVGWGQRLLIILMKKPEWIPKQKTFLSPETEQCEGVLIHRDSDDMELQVNHLNLWVRESLEGKMKTAQKPKCMLYTMLFTDSWGFSLPIRQLHIYTLL